MSTIIRIATYLAIVMAALATTSMFALRDRAESVSQKALDRSKDESGAVSLETILIAVALAGFAAVVAGLIGAKINSEGGKL